MKTVLHFHAASWCYIIGSSFFILGTVLKEVVR